jgi:hypothetical protein
MERPATDGAFPHKFQFDDESGALRKQLLNHQQRVNDGNYSEDEVRSRATFTKKQDYIEADVRRQMR